MVDEEGNETEDVSKAVAITTDYLSKAQEIETGRDNLLEAYDSAKILYPNATITKKNN